MSDAVFAECVSEIFDEFSARISHQSRDARIKHALKLASKLVEYAGYETAMKCSAVTTARFIMQAAELERAANLVGEPDITTAALTHDF